MQIVAKSEEQPASWESTVSAWVDGQDDLRPEDLDSPYGRQLWDTYHLIGDVLRNEELALQPSDRFYARVSKAIDAEPPIVAPRRRPLPSFKRMGLSGAAIAAAVLTVMWVAYPSIFDTSDVSASQQVFASTDDAGMRDYIEAHRQFAGASPIRQVSFDLGADR